MTALPDYPQALAAALRGIGPLKRTEKIALDKASHRVLAEPIIADRDLPPFNRAQMDGYALRGREYSRARSWKVASVIAAGGSADVRVPPGHCVKIATGAPLPDDVDTVIQHELSDCGDQNGGQVRFSVESIGRGQAVHLRGADARSGDVLIKAGTALGAHHLGIAAAVGAQDVSVASKLRAAVLTSGDEVVVAGAPVQPHQIRNSNAPMIAELLSRFGAEVIESKHLLDEPESTADAVAAAIAAADRVITVGGVSAGERDHFPAAFAASNVVKSLQGASIQPGRPIFVGRAVNGAVVIGLPRKPVSLIACTGRLARPLVHTNLGLDPSLPWREVELAEPVKPNPHRRAFRPAILNENGCAIVPSWAGSGDLAHTAPTHGLLELPIQSDPVPSATPLRFLAWP
jgi:molybdopterin molybdotransferase